MAENNSSAPLKTTEGAYPALPEPTTWLVERGAFCASPHGQDAESNEWLEEAHEPGEKGSFTVYTEQQLKDFADATHAVRLKCKSEQKRLATLWGFQAAPAAVAVTEAQIDAILDEPAGMIFHVSDQRHKQHLFARRVLALATPALPATEDSSACDLAEKTRDDEGISRGDWLAQAERLYLAVGDTQDEARMCASYLYNEQDWDGFGGDDPIHAALDDVEGRSPKAEVQAEPVAAGEYLPLPMQVACNGYFPVYSSEQMREYADAHRNTATQSRPAFQQRVQPLMIEWLGTERAADRNNRNHHFLEEALELVQSTGWTQNKAHQLVDYVFCCPARDPAPQVGGVMVALAALCLANGLDMHQAGETELARIWGNVDPIRGRRMAIPSFSPAPQAQPADALDTERLDWILRQGDEFSCYVIQDAPGDGDYWVTGMKSSGQHKDPRAAIDAAMAAAQEGGAA